MNGKKKCKILKEIRRQIAMQNDIEYITSECQHKGDCKGTCPKCEAEVRYLEKELEKRQNLGRTVAVAGIAAALAVSTMGCTLDKQKAPETENTENLTSGPDFEELFFLEQGARNEYISKYSREQIHNAWGEYLGTTFNTVDSFLITYNGELYYVEVLYDKDRTHEDRMPIRISIEIDGVTPGDPAY